MIFDSWILINGNIAKGKITEYGVECEECFPCPLSRIDLLKAIACARNNTKLDLNYIPEKSISVPTLFPKVTIIEAIPEWETIRTWYDL